MECGFKITKRLCIFQTWPCTGWHAAYNRPIRNEAFPQKAHVNVQVGDVESSALSGSGKLRPRESALASQRFSVLSVVYPGSEAPFQIHVSPSFMLSEETLTNSCTQRGNDPEAPFWGPLHLIRWSAECGKLTGKGFRAINEAKKGFLVLLFGEIHPERPLTSSFKCKGCLFWGLRRDRPQRERS